MKRNVGKGGLAALIVSVIAVVIAAVGTSSADVEAGSGTKVLTRASTAAAGPTTKTFSFIGKPGGKTSPALINVDGFSMNARCSKTGTPIIFAFSSARVADLLGRVFDGLGRFHLIHNTSFTNKTKGMSVSTSSGDFDSTGTLLFEAQQGKTAKTVRSTMRSTTARR
jgi:hypothetical protein